MKQIHEIFIKKKNGKKLSIFVVIVYTFLAFTILTAGEGNPRIGKKIYYLLKCDRCHADSLATKKKYEKLGTYIAGNPNNRSADWIREYLRNPVKMRAADPILKKTIGKFKEFMTPPQLSEREMDHLVAYCLAM